MAREVSDHLHCDDTSARHRGKPAVCTHIGNEWFASFTTTDSKSRLNFLHGLCWVHGERKIDRLIPVTDAHRAAQEQAQSAFWEIYDQLKLYRGAPAPELRGRIEACFNSLCLTETEYPELNAALSLLYAKREQFLAVLQYPHLPLHNNLSENDIREYARLRKISAGTRSDQGRRHPITQANDFESRGHLLLHAARSPWGY